MKFPCVDVASPVALAGRALVVAGLFGLIAQAPARAGLGSVTVSQTGGTTSFTVVGAEITTSPKPPNFAGVSSPFQYKVNFFNAPTISKLGTGASSYYLFQYDNSDFQFDFIQNLTGTGFLSGTFDPNTVPPLGSTMKVYENGNIDLQIFSIDPTIVPCYMGLTIVGATGSNCSPYLNSLNLVFSTGVTGKVVSGPASTTVNALLSNFAGSYTGTGSFSAGGGESLVNYSVTQASVPAPAPIIGAAAAFRISRRIRRRIGLQRIASS